MPSYNYKCKDCEITFSVVHRLKETCDKCTQCASQSITQVPASFAASTETSFESQMRQHEDQGHRDVARYHKDDKFASNVTGQFDEGSAKRRDAVIDREQTKQENARKKIKRLDPK